MKAHKIKIIQKYYDQVKSGAKTFELRKNDRGYQVGSVLILQEIVHKGNGVIHIHCTGRELPCEITYILQGYEGLEDGYCILGIRLI